MAGYKLYDFTQPFGKTKEVDPNFGPQLDEQLKLFADLLYNKREDYPGQLVSVDYSQTVSRPRPLTDSYVNGVLRIQALETGIPQTGGPDGVSDSNPVGTGTNGNTDDPDGHYFVPTTGATTNNSFGIVGGSTASRWQFIHQPYFEAHIKTPTTISSMKMCVGFAGQSAVKRIGTLIDYATDIGGARAPRAFGFVYDSSHATYPTQWVFVVSHENAAGALVIDAEVGTGMTVIADTQYWFTAQLQRLLGNYVAPPTGSNGDYTGAWSISRRTIDQSTLIGSNIETLTGDAGGTITIIDQGSIASGEVLSAVIGVKTLSNNTRSIKFKSFYAESYTPIFD